MFVRRRRRSRRRALLEQSSVAGDLAVRRGAAAVGMSGGSAGDEDVQATYKVILVGESGVGKTNLLASFAAQHAALEAKRHGRTGEVSARLLGEHGAGNSRGGFLDGYSELRQPTIGSEFFACTVAHPTDGTKSRFQIWDTAGQERYRSVSSGQYRRAAGALLVYDVCNRKSLEAAVGYWYDELTAWPLGEVLCLIGNKSDLYDENNPDHVTPEEHAQAAKKILASSMERTSAKTGQKVIEGFTRFFVKVQQVSHEHQNHPVGTLSNLQSAIGLSERFQTNSGNCC